MESEDMDNQIMRLDTSGYLVEDDTTYIVNSDDVLGEANLIRFVKHQHVNTS